MRSVGILHFALLFSLYAVSATAEGLHDGPGSQPPRSRGFADALPSPMTAFERQRRESPLIDAFARSLEARFGANVVTAMWLYKEDFRTPQDVQNLIRKLEALRPAIQALSRWGTITLSGSPGVYAAALAGPGTAPVRHAIMLDYRMSLQETLARMADLYRKQTARDWFRSHGVDLMFGMMMSDQDSERFARLVYSKLDRIRRSPLFGKVQFEGFPSGQIITPEPTRLVVKLRANDGADELERKLTELERSAPRNRF